MREFMKIGKDSNTRYFIEVDLITGKVVNIDSGDKYKLINNITDETHHRIYLSIGQFNKFKERFENYRIS